MVRLPLRPALRAAPPPGGPARTRSGRALALPAVLSLGLALSLAGCSGDDDEPDSDDPPASSSAPSGPPPVETVARVGEVVGRLDKQRQQRLTTQVAEVVDTWIDAAYLGDYPRRDFSDAFSGFTKGAAADAAVDAGLMSNKQYGAKLEQVVATRRQVVVDALAVRKNAVGATAHVVLMMTLDGDVKRKERVSGRLFLTFVDGAWRVFGYDMNRGRGR